MSRFKVALGVAVAGLLLNVSACHREGPAEKAGKELDKALDNAGDEMKKAGKSVSDKIDDAGDKMRDAAGG
jgi:MT0933-like antitoxin protein